MSEQGFNEVLEWLKAERGYQIKKFGRDDEETYSAEFAKGPDYWNQQFENYMYRLPLFGFDNAPGIQAALKLAATVVALCEHMADEYELPQAGLPSSYFQ